MNPVHERQRPVSAGWQAFKTFDSPCLLDVIHDDNDALTPADKVHRAAHALISLRGIIQFADRHSRRLPSRQNRQIAMLARGFMPKDVQNRRNAVCAVR